MKKLVFVLLLLTNYANSQWGLEGNFNVIHTGRNLSCQVLYTLNDLTFTAGFKYNLNRLDRFPSNTYFRKTFFTQNNGEHLGIELGAQYLLFEKNKLTLFAHYNLQISKSHIRYESYSVIDSNFSWVPNPTTLADYPLTYDLQFLGPITVFENTIGLGLNVALTKKFYLTQKIGLGVCVYFSKDKVLEPVLEKKRVELGELYSIGFGYRFN